MIKAFFKGIGTVLLVSLIVAIGIIGLIGIVYLGIYIGPILSIIALIGVAAISYGILSAYQAYQQMHDLEYKYQKEKKLIQDMRKANWLTEEEYKVMMSKLITKHHNHNKGVK